MHKQIQKDFDLKAYNTFGISARAAYFASVQTVEDLKTLLSQEGLPPVFILGGGSNLLLTKDLEALVIHMDLKGKKVVERHEDYTLVEIASGEIWHETVLWSIAENLGGIENLALIPGKVGAAPIQNIGAYGRELKDTFHSCTAIHLETLEIITLNREECQFGYRDSFFKREGKGKYAILSVRLKLSNPPHQLNTDYGAIKQVLEERQITNPGIQDVAEAVIHIRKTKLPDPAVLGNSGSFFKNPVISASHFEKLTTRYPEMPHFPVSDKQVKIPAGWLIEKCGFKGKQFGNAGVHSQQALVLVNRGGATGSEIAALASHIQQTVKETFDIAIEAEVNIL